MNILSIESSCDETAAAVIQNGQHILSNVVVSQIDIFKAYGGVIPEIAARSHLEAILPVIHQALSQAFPHQTASQQWSHIDAIAVTHTPGLLGSLLVGTLTARTLAILHHKPLYPVHHLKSHIYANWLLPPDSATSQSPTASKSSSISAATPSHPSSVPTFPLLALVVSGGHTQIIYMTAHNDFHIIGTTRDDAVGECFDKIAKILGLPYPGGPAIAAAAQGQLPHQPISSPGNPHRYHFPHPHLTSPARSGNSTTHHSDLDFSFSGLKTAVLRSVQHELHLPINHPSHDLKNHLTPAQVKDFAASFQQTAIDILIENLQHAFSHYPHVQNLVIAGGVSANSLLRHTALQTFPTVFFPSPSFSGDNAAMVGAAAHYEIQSGVQPTDPYSLNIAPRSQIY